MTSYPRMSHRQMVTYAANTDCQQSHDHAVEMFAKNHYIFRNGLAQVHVQICDAPPEGHKLEIEGPIDSVIRLAAYMVAVIIVILTFVIKVSTVIVNQFDRGVETKFLLFLYVIASIWTIYCLIPGVYSEQLLTFSKTNKSSNRWLNCVITIFGLTIFIQDGLKLISFSFIDISKCPDEQVEIALSVFHMTFVISQIVYILRYLKVYIQCLSHEYCRVGLMLLIATNLSNWLSLIVDEAEIALRAHTVENLTGTTETRSIHEKIPPSSHSTAINRTEKDPCICLHPFCDAAHLAERFLFPFILEFCIVASSLLFVIASNIDKQPSPFEKVVKPSYRFFNSIVGVSFGFIAILATTITINYLSSTRDDGKHYIDYIKTFYTLQAYNYYMIIVELSMIAACGFGFYYFTKLIQPLEAPVLLDVVLLSICVVGPIGLNMFTMVAVISGHGNKITGWWITAALPCIDILQCVMQFTLILYGLKREPLPSPIVQQAAENLRKNVVSELKQHNIICTTSVNDHVEDIIKYQTPVLNSVKKTTNDGDMEEVDDAPSNLMKWQHYNRRRASNYMRHARTSVVSAMASIANPFNNFTSRRHSLISVPNTDQQSSSSPVSLSTSPTLKHNATSFTLINGNGTRNDSSSMTTETLNLESTLEQNGENEHLTQAENNQESVLKFVTETQIARPLNDHTRLRNFVMYLLISNSCLWVFLSLEGTAFDTHPFQLAYYGASTWTTVLMICRPLIIFFRMHSAGCLFEIWSYA